MIFIRSRKIDFSMSFFVSFCCDDLHLETSLTGLGEDEDASSKMLSTNIYANWLKDHQGHHLEEEKRKLIFTLLYTCLHWTDIYENELLVNVTIKTTVFLYSFSFLLDLELALCPVVWHFVLLFFFFPSSRFFFFLLSLLLERQFHLTDILFSFSIHLVIFIESYYHSFHCFFPYFQWRTICPNGSNISSFSTFSLFLFIHFYFTLFIKFSLFHLDRSKCEFVKKKKKLITYIVKKETFFSSFFCVICRWMNCWRC